MTITVKIEDSELSLTTHDDMNLDELRDIFKTIMVWLTWCPEHIEELLGEK